MTASEILAMELMDDFTQADFPMSEAARTAGDFYGIPAARLISLATISD